MNCFECQSCGAFIDEDAHGIAAICPYCNSRNLKKTGEEKGDISLNCPYCSGAFKLPNSYNMSRCPYCNRNIFIRMTKNIQQYFLEPVRSINEARDTASKKGFSKMEKTVYIPFWGLRGIMVSWVLGYYMKEGYKMPSTRMATSTSYEGGLAQATYNIKEQKIYKDYKTKVLFLTMGDHIARQIKNYTLGTRIYMETLTIKDYDKLSQSSNILKPLFQAEQAVDKLFDQIYKTPHLSNDKVVVQSVRIDLLGTRILVIYEPFYRFSKNGQSLLIDSSSGDTHIIFDHLLFDPTPKTIEDTLYDFNTTSRQGKDKYSLGILDLVPFSCPECGEDLPEKKLDCFVRCINCGKNLIIEQGSLKSINAYFIKIPRKFHDNPNKCRIKYYPYWRYKVSFYNKGRKIDKVNEFKNLFLGFNDRFKRSLEFENTFMYIPAFGRIKTPGLDKISIIYTKMQIVYEYFREEEGEHERAAVIYDEKDAKNFAYTILLKLHNLNSSSNITRVRDNFVRLKEGAIYYFPFLINPVGMHLDPVLGLNYTKSSFISERSY